MRPVVATQVTTAPLFSRSRYPCSTGVHFPAIPRARRWWLAWKSSGAQSRSLDGSALGQISPLNFERCHAVAA